MPKDYDKIPLFFYHYDININNLFKSIVDNNIEKMKECIKAGASVDSICELKLRWTPLLIAYVLGRKEIYFYLISLNPNRDATLLDGRGIGSLMNASNKDW